MFERTSFLETLSTISLFLFFVLSVAFISLILTSTAGAQSAALANDPATLATSAEGSSRTFVFNTQAIFETARSADEAQATSYSGYYVLTSSATHKQSAVTGTLRAGYSREYNYRRDDNTDGAFDNPIFSISKSFLKDRDFSLTWLDSASISLSGSVGANKESARRTFLWSNGIAVTGSKTLGRFSLRQTFGYSHSFFEYDIRDDGTVNSPAALRSLTSLYYDISPKLSVGGAMTYTVAQSFQGVSRGMQLAQASLDYLVTEKISASIGVGSERFTLEANGQSDRIRLYTPEAAQYFFDVIISL